MRSTFVIGKRIIKAEKIPDAKILPIWEALIEKPFPKVMALQLDDDDFDFVIDQMKRSACGKEDEKREVEEWGKILTTRGTDACVFNSDETPGVDYIILIRKNPYNPLEDILKHELSHIARGDL